MPRILAPTYMAPCPTCEASTPHSGLTDESGREIGQFCITCELRRERLAEIAKLYNRTQRQKEPA